MLASHVRRQPASAAAGRGVDGDHADRTGWARPHGEWVAWASTRDSGWQRGRRINWPGRRGAASTHGASCSKNRPWAMLDVTMAWLRWRATERNTKRCIVRPVRWPR